MKDMSSVIDQINLSFVSWRITGQHVSLYKRGDIAFLAYNLTTKLAIHSTKAQQYFTAEKFGFLVVGDDNILN